MYLFVEYYNNIINTITCKVSVIVTYYVTNVQLNYEICFSKLCDPLNVRQHVFKFESF